MMIGAMLALAAATAHAQLPHADVPQCRDALIRSQNQTGVDAFRNGDLLPGVVIGGGTENLTAAAPGRVRAIHVHDGERVAAGALLLEIDDEAGARELAKLGPEQAAAHFASLQQAADVERLRQENARRSAHPDLFSTEDREAHTAELAGAQAHLSEMRTREQASAIERGQLSQRQASLQLRAAAAGIVVRVYRNQGERVETGAPLLDLVGDALPTIRFALPPEAAARFAPGANICLRVAASEHMVQAQVIRLGSTVDAAAQVRFAEAQSAAGTDAIAPGTAVDVMPLNGAKP